MASRLAPRALPEAPREAAGEQFASLRDEGRYREVGGASHNADLILGVPKVIFTHDRSKDQKLNKMGIVEWMLLLSTWRAEVDAKQDPFDDSRIARLGPTILLHCHIEHAEPE